MTQEQLQQLYEDAKELMVYDDMTEVFNFISYLADKYELLFDYDAAYDEQMHNAEVYLMPKEL